MRKNNISIIEVLFFVAYILLIVNYMTTAVLGFEILRKIFTVLICGSLLFIIIVQSKKYKKKSLLYIFILAVSSFISYLFTGEATLFMTILFVIAAKNVSFDSVLRFDFWLKIIITSLIIFLYFNGFTEIIRRYRPDGTIRYAMGFGHPNVFAAYLFFICLDLFCLKYRKLKFWDLCVFFMIFFVVSIVCDSRTVQVSLIILLFLSYIFPKIEKNRFIKIMVILLPVFLFIISILSVLMYIREIPLAYKIDNIFNKRLWYSSVLINQYGFSLFGSDLSNALIPGIDNTYVNLLLQHGIIPMLLMIGSFSFLLTKAYKERKYNIIMCFIVILIYGLMEKFSYMIGYNALLIYMSNLIYFKESK